MALKLIKQNTKLNKDGTPRKTAMKYKEIAGKIVLVPSAQKWTAENAIPIFEEIIKNINEDPEVLSIALLLYSKKFKYQGISYNMLMNIIKQIPECKEAYDEVIICLKEKLISKSLSGELNSTMAKFVLSAGYGMSEKTEQTVVVKERTKFEFGNPELNALNPSKETDKAEDIDFEDIESNE